jgi:TonB family protein
LKAKDVDGECAEITKPVEIEKTTPKYPERARQDKVMGMVIVETMISDEGLVEDARVVESPDERLSAAAVEAAREWRFEPALCDGKPASVSYNLTFNFRLE